MAPRPPIQHPVIDLAMIDNKSYKEALCGSKRADSMPRIENSPFEQDQSGSSDSSSTSVGSFDPLFLNIDILKDDLEWLNRSMVGKPYGGVDCEVLKGELSKEGLLVQLAYLSSLNTLITFPSSNSKEASLRSHAGDSKGVIPNIISGKISIIPFKIIRSSFMVAPSPVLEGKSSSKGTSKGSSSRTSLPASYSSMGIRNVSSGSNKEFNNNVERVNEDEELVQKEKGEPSEILSLKKKYRCFIFRNPNVKRLILSSTCFYGGRELSMVSSQMQLEKQEGSIEALDMKCVFVNVYAPNNDNERRSFFDNFDLRNKLYQYKGELWKLM
ncbi:hypothetical protein CCACVL1_18082 [Corchorus capsularis]|uniref:Uncharacterized protein n=1 Tax=Corchorus capsularis TaxID=210143 RepID=A0A1R3HNG4_COCAP|nr:hypothetical protein CCACVL1_18082 [Corchorus capsularis]